VAAAANGSGWVEVIVGLSIFVPVVAAAALAWWVLRGGRSDPDAARLRRQQEDYERAHREP
jgi:hypothetical protein